MNNIFTQFNTAVSNASVKVMADYVQIRPWRVAGKGLGGRDSPTLSTIYIIL